MLSSHIVWGDQFIVPKDGANLGVEGIEGGRRKLFDCSSVELGRQV
jgi:hypothetical protein